MHRRVSGDVGAGDGPLAGLVTGAHALTLGLEPVDDAVAAARNRRGSSGSDACLNVGALPSRPKKWRGQIPRRQSMDEGRPAQPAGRMSPQLLDSTLLPRPNLSAGAKSTPRKERASQVEQPTGSRRLLELDAPDSGPAAMPPPVHVASTVSVGGNPAPRFLLERRGRARADSTGPPQSTVASLGGSSLMEGSLQSVPSGFDTGRPATVGSGSPMLFRDSVAGSSDHPPQLSSEGAVDDGDETLVQHVVTNAARVPLNSAASEAIGQGPGGFRLAPPEKLPPKQAHETAARQNKEVRGGNLLGPFCHRSGRLGQPRLSHAVPAGVAAQRLLARLQQSVAVVDAHENAEAIEAEKYERTAGTVRVTASVPSPPKHTNIKLPPPGDSDDADDNDSVHGDLVREQASELRGSFLQPDDVALLEKAVAEAADRLATQPQPGSVVDSTDDDKTPATSPVAAGSADLEQGDDNTPSPRFHTAATALNMQAVLREAKSKERQKQKEIRNARRVARREARRRHREKLEESKRALRERQLMAAEDQLASKRCVAGGTELVRVGGAPALCSR